MTKEQVENIWERFYKADISRKNNEFSESGLVYRLLNNSLNYIKPYHGEWSRRWDNIYYFMTVKHWQKNKVE